jgi:hypothetical protein
MISAGTEKKDTVWYTFYFWEEMSVLDWLLLLYKCLFTFYFKRLNIQEVKRINNTEIAERSSTHCHRFTWIKEVSPSLLSQV